MHDLFYESIRGDGYFRNVPEQYREVITKTVRNSKKLRAGYLLSDFETYEQLSEFEEIAVVAYQSAIDQYDREESDKIKKQNNTID